MRLLLMVFLLSLPLFAHSAAGGDALFTYEGVLTDATGNPISTPQNLTLQLVYGGNCVAYEETQVVSPGSFGEFSVTVGAGTRTDSTGNSAGKIFAPSGSIQCASGSPMAIAGTQGRSLRIIVGTTTLSPDVAITHVPYAIESMQISGYKANNLVRVDDPAGISALTMGQYNKMLDLMSPAGGAIRVGTDTTTCGSPVAGAIRYNAGSLEFCNGTAWTALSVGGSGVSSLNGLTVSSQTFAVGTAGLAPAFNSSSSIHTLNIPMANTASVTAGLLSKAEYDSFNSKLGASTAFSGDVSGTYNALTLANVITAGTFTKVTTDAKGRVTSGSTLLATDIPGLDWTKITSGVPTTLGGFGITDGVKNLTGVPSLQAGNLSARPTAALEGRIFIGTDTNTIYRDNGTAWIAIGDGVGAGGGGTVVSVSSANTDIVVANSTTNPTLTLNSASSGGVSDANKIAKLNSSGQLPSGMLPSSLAGITSSVQTQLDSKAKLADWSNFSVIGTDGSGVMTAVTGSVNGSVLQYSAMGPVYSATSYPGTTTANQLLYSSSNNVVGGLATANNSVLVTNGAGVPGWSPLGNDVFAQYAMLSGRSGGQSMNGGTAAGESLMIDSTSNSTKGNIYLNPAGGKVGIGTLMPQAALHVAGNIKFGNQPIAAPCDGSYEGQQRYNATAKLMEYCNGTEWVGIGGRTNCPTGFSLVGTAGSSDAFCISTNMEPSKTWTQAIQNCRSKAPKARLCSSAEWVAACLDGAATGMTGTNKWEWVAEFASNDFTNYDHPNDPLDNLETKHPGTVYPRMMGGGSTTPSACTTGAHDDSTQAFGSRCCIH